MTTLAVVAVPTSGCPSWARWPLGCRAAALIVGRCPGCGADGPTGETFRHDPTCPAIDEQLGELGPHDVELRAVVVELDAEAAA